MADRGELTVVCRRELDWHRAATVDADVWDFGPQIVRLESRLADLVAGRPVQFYGFEVPADVRPPPPGLWTLADGVMTPSTYESVGGEMRRF
jgi:hypothetical protein